MRAGISALLTALVLVTACGGEKPVKPPVDPRDAQMAALEKEKARLLAELQAAHQSSATLDATLRGVEEDLGALVGMDADIRKLQRDIEGGINAKSSRANIRKMIEKLKVAMSTRQNLITKAQTTLGPVKAQVASQPDARVREQYTRQLARLETLITAGVEENARLTRERNTYERLYREAAADAKKARDETEAVTIERDAERVQREDAERLRYRVFIISAPKAELREKGVLSGRWYQRKTSSCECEDCLEEEDRRTLETIKVPAVPKRVKVHSSHPKASFRIVADGAEAAVVEIIDADSFWSASHCLVIGY